MTSQTSSRPVLSPGAARRIFLVLSFTRWFPVGLVVGVLTLWQIERGLTVAQAMTVAAVGGLTIFVLELPTSGFADAFGRKPVFVVSAIVNVAASLLLLAAHSFWAFLVAGVLTGIFRALDSGPLGVVRRHGPCHRARCRRRRCAGRTGFGPRRSNRCRRLGVRSPHLVAPTHSHLGSGPSRRGLRGPQRAAPGCRAHPAS